MTALLAQRPRALLRLALCPPPSRPRAPGQAAGAAAAALRWRSTTAGELGALLERVSETIGTDRSGGDDGATRPVHIVHSLGRDPFANLALEHRLFERAHATSRLLLLYRNRPCVVIGRNQNPWTEVRLARLAAAGVQLVRRRSGGGAVYHDAGNANWSVHIPAAGFDRDHHAIMVARALQRLGVTTAHVNERHDIVVRGGGGTKNDGTNDDTYKVSGSAYKLTSRRALHHGTCLLGADLAAVSGLLHAPAAAPYLKARGVASVRSPVRNVVLASDANEDAHDPHDHFGTAVAAEFESMYGSATSRTVVDVDALAAADGFAFDPKLAEGYAELRTAEWLFGQTPQFTFSTRPTRDDPRARPARPEGVPLGFDLSFTARHGELHDVVVAGLPYDGSVSPASAPASASSATDQAVAATLEGQRLYDIRDWHAALAAASPVPLAAIPTAALGAWLDELFGTPRAAEAQT